MNTGTISGPMPQQSVVGSQRVRFWLEWDCGIMNVRDLAIKFASYAHYIDSREWATEHTMLPRLVCIAPHIAQERRMQRISQVRLAQKVWTSTEGLLHVYGPSSDFVREDRAADQHEVIRKD
jgi:hypothetical protein